MDNIIKMQEIDANGFTFTCRTCGLDNDGDFVILLHGFPESSYMWKDVMVKLGELGYRCLAPDQRGYSKKARPKEEELYAMNYLVDDVIALADHFGVEKFHLIGHDWGTNVSWATVALKQDRVISACNLSSYYPAENFSIMSGNMNQRKMSQYIFEFLEDSAVDRLYANNSEEIKKGYWYEMPQENIDEYMKIFGDKEGILGALCWYRAKYRWLTDPEHYKPFPFAETHGDVNIPCTSIRGVNDPYQSVAGYLTMHKYFKNYYSYTQIDAGHWLLENNAEYCIPAIVRHLEMFKVSK